MRVKNETKIALVTGICLFSLAIISAARGIHLNPVMQAAPAYFFIIHIILRNQLGMACRMCPWTIVAVTLLVVALFLL